MDTTIKVDGMTCGHCVTAVTGELTALPAVTNVVVDLHADEISTVTITSDAPLADDEVRAAINEAGYAVIA